LVVDAPSSALVAFVVVIVATVANGWRDKQGRIVVDMVGCRRLARIQRTNKLVVHVDKIGNMPLEPKWLWMITLPCLPPASGQEAELGVPGQHEKASWHRFSIDFGGFLGVKLGRKIESRSEKKWIKNYDAKQKPFPTRLGAVLGRF